MPPSSPSDAPESYPQVWIKQWIVELARLRTDKRHCVNKLMCINTLRDYSPCLAE